MPARPARRVLLAAAILIGNATFASAQMVHWSEWQFSSSQGVPQPNLPAGVAIDASGDVLLVGSQTYSNSSPNVLTVVTKISGVTGNLIWLRLMQVGIDDHPAGIAVDAVGNALVTGKTTTSDGSSLMLTAKFAASDGTRLWTRSLGTITDAGLALAVDSNSDVLVTGYTNSGSQGRTAKLGSSDGSIQWAWLRDETFGPGHSITVDDSRDVFAGYAFQTVKHDLNGTPSWTQPFPGERSYALAADPQGNSYVVGSSLGGIRTIKYGPDGGVLWDKSSDHIAASANDFRIAFDGAGNAIVAGDFPGVSSTQVMRVIKYSSASGDVLWEQSIGGEPGWTYSAKAVRADAAGNIVVAGSRGPSPAAFPGATTNLFAVKLTPSGNRLWQFEHNGTATASQDSALFIATSPSAVFLGGYSQDAGTNFLIRTIKIDATRNWSGFDNYRENNPDLFFAHADGRAAMWLMNGAAPTGTREIIGPGTGWSVSMVADFNGDGKSDIVWRHTDERMAIYLMDGNTPASTQQMLGAGTGWYAVHAPDLNGDGKADLVFEKSDGSTAVWIMDGTTVTAGATILGAASGWHVTHTGDFDGDGKADLLWTHEDGRVAIWLMDGPTVKATNQILNAGTGWSVSHVADLDGDGKADIVWQNIDGSVAAWLMDGTMMAAGSGLLPANTGWIVAKIGDFDGDGKTDLLFQHIDGRAAIYLMNGLTPTSTQQILNAGGGWSAAKILDLNGDGKSDIVWQNSDGTVAAWLMNGTAMSSGSTLIGASSGWSVTP